MSNDQPGRRPPAKSSGGGAPMGSTISIVIAVVAVVVGFLILRNITDDSGSGGSGGIETPGSVGTDGSIPVDPGATTTTLPQIVTSTTTPLDFAATVVVANALGVPGAAGQLTDAVKAAGFTTADPTNAFGVEQRLDVSKVYYLAGGEGTAASVAQVMGGIQVAAMPTPVPVENEAAGLGSATVLLMLGKDYGGHTVLPGTATDTSTTLPAAPLATTTTIAG